VSTIVGLDGSLTAYGGAVLYSHAQLSPDLYTWKTSPRQGIHARFRHLAISVLTACKGAELVVLEGLAFGAKGSAVTDLAGLHWIIRQLLWTNGYQYAIVPPPVRSKWLTGNGRAGKDECLAAAIKRFGHLADIADNNQADAITVAAMGAARMGCPLVQMPASSDEQLAKVSWPEK
jgi:crossover junction endodeoxyribonuclease RuvC